MIPLLLAIAAVALYVLPLVMPRPQEPDDIALPPLGPATPAQSDAPTFVAAVRAVEVVVVYLRSTGQYGATQVDAARVLRAAVVEGATPGPDSTKGVP